MKKQHKIIYIDDYAVIIDETQKKKLADYFHSKEIVKDYLFEENFSTKIIASTKNTPYISSEMILFDLPNNEDDEIEKLIKDYYGDINDINYQISADKGLVAFVLQTSTKKYSEENLKKAFGAGFERGYEASPIEPKLYKNPDFDEFFQSFNQSKKPVSCMIEYESTFPGSDLSLSGIKEIPKTDSNNKLIIKEWIY